MQEELKKAKEDAMDEFKTKELSGLLQREFHLGFMAFANSNKGEEYNHVEWGRGLIDYRNVIIHYNPLSKEIDQHFSDLFVYAVTKGKVLLKIVDCYIPNPPKEKGGDEGIPEGATTSTLAQP